MAVAVDIKERFAGTDDPEIEEEIKKAISAIEIMVNELCKDKEDETEEAKIDKETP
jgi:hypothetical protein